MASPERPELLAAGGETAKLVHEMDWAKTPLGPLETWPQSLLTSVGLCLASNLPIAIVWGPEHTQIYNDAYRSLRGPSQPHALGERFDASWLSGGSALGEALERASAGQTVSLASQRIFLDRNGGLEEAFFGFSFSPIRDEAGGVGGLFHTAVEGTQRVLAERRLAALRELAERSADAVAPAAVCTRIGEVLGAHALDVPFALLYRVDADGRGASLAASAGLAPEAEASPARIELAAGRPAAWPLAEALGRGKVVQVDSLAQRFG